jgi:hypothetical protein
MLIGIVVWFALVNKSGTIALPNYSLTTPLPPTTPHFTPQGYGLCTYANPLTKTFVGDYQQVMGGLKKLSPKNLHMSKVVITFTPSNNN